MHPSFNEETNLYDCKYCNYAHKDKREFNSHVRNRHNQMEAKELLTEQDYEWQYLKKKKL